MKAMLYTQYGPPAVLHLAEIPQPEPKADEVLVRVRATTVTIGDTIMRSLNLPGSALQRLAARLYLGLRRPKRPILGMEIAGEVAAVGSQVTRFKAGDPVFASTFATGFGGYAEYKCLPQTGVLAHLPAGCPYPAAAALPGAGMTALHCLRKASIQPGQRVLIYGASGAVGTYAVQLAAHHFGAEVTGVCSTSNLALVKSLGASTAIDYTKEDFTQRSEKYAVIFDAVGKLPPVQRQAARRLAGKTLNVHLDSDGGDKLENLLFIKELVEVGKLRAVIDRTYPFEEIPVAHRYVEQGHKKGNVAILV